MPTVSPPFVLPSSLNFYCNDESTLTQRVCVYNPYAFDILYKDVSCHRKEISHDDRIQIRFYKWPRPRQGVRPRTQQYIGYREIKFCVYNDVGERERTLSQSSDRMSIGASSSITNNPEPSSLSSNTPRHQCGTGSNVSVQALAAHHKWQVWMNLCLTIVLLLVGFLLSKTDEDWFSTHILEGIKPHTMAVVFYTLGGVLIIKLLTYR